MACLDKLAIRGIRSFDDKHIGVIEFFPVTVIVGANGSGKTTIIECLKYATTGDQPPNTRGGAFVHDPKMANEKEVKAQVKLRFFAANGNRMLAVRNLSVTQKKTGSLTMKTLESVLALADGNENRSGKRGAISTKCAEMDVEIPNLLGVSKAVLENVIFCHQEDSYWPLAEPAALKKKFDDIFEATKYTKALQAIKDLRKERVADLKTDKERLESLVREKGHADKLKRQVSELTAAIATKEVQYEETNNKYHELVLINKKFYEQASKFSTMYKEIESLQKQKARCEEDLQEVQVNIKEITGTDKELEDRLRNFDSHIQRQRDEKRQQENRLAENEDNLAMIRKKHLELVSRQGELVREEKEQEQRITDREERIRDIANKYNLKGYDHSPLEREKVVDFIARMSDLQRRQNTETERIQADARSQEESYNRQSRALHSDVQSLRARKTTLKDQMSTLQNSITQDETKFDAAANISTDIQTLNADIEEKKSRIAKLQADIKAANYDQRLSEKASKAREMEEEREKLNNEITTLSLQADSRARLELKRAELRSKKTEASNVLENSKTKFRKLVGANPKAETMEREVERVNAEKDREHTELESLSNAANRALQQAENFMSSLKAQVKAKQDDVKKMDKRLRDELSGQDHATIGEAIKEAHTEIKIRQDTVGISTGSQESWKQLLRQGSDNEICPACNRHMNAAEMKVFQMMLKDFMNKSSPENIKTEKEELEEWQNELKRLETFRPIEDSRNRLRDIDIPALERQVQEQEDSLPDLSKAAEQALDRLNALKTEVKELSALKMQAVSVTKAVKDIERLTGEVEAIEKDLAVTGTTKTAEDVQSDLTALADKIRANAREQQGLITERDRQANALRGHESDLHSMQLREAGLQNQLHQQNALEQAIIARRRELQELTAQSKTLDPQTLDAQSKLDQFEQQHKQQQQEQDRLLSQAQARSQELNMTVDRLESVNKIIERYVREKRGRLLKEVEEDIERKEDEVKQLSLSAEEIRARIADIDKEISESGASTANLRENIRARKLRAEIVSLQAQIDAHDIEGAAKAQRNFESKYKEQKDLETEMQSKAAHIGGELSSDRVQLKRLQTDMRDFKDIQRKYTDQLIKVKMSDMANSDLEKYGKALDNAIMKYHSLKMEEVNDNMRHLWNKTYQGTDIDGIAIRYDAEGGVSKRSYNYRVVMAKDQVEMDMRGRCSAGQKMLASIIIRLALSDSFGQNCGILALDEPTNALDLDNIDALAASLVDIINERKNHSNFQLIIITHDENFLRKLGQSEVMEYYWRISRDKRQKSVIERQRFR